MGAKAFLSVFNHRVLFVVVETLLIYFLYDAYDIHLETDFTIISIAIVFPLVFSITSAYQRRQDAVELFINFRNKIIHLTNILFAVNDFKKEDFISALEKMLNMTEIEKEELGKKCRKHVEDNFNPDVLLSKWDEHLSDLHNKCGSWETRKNFKSWTFKEID